MLDIEALHYPAVDLLYCRRAVAGDITVVGKSIKSSYIDVRATVK